MDQQVLLLWVMAGFVIVSAIALCVQAGFLFGMYKAIKSLEERASTLVPQAKNIMGTAESMLAENRPRVTEIMTRATEVSAHASEIAAKASDMMDTAKVQMTRIDALVDDASKRAHNQLERAELVVEDTVGRVHESVSAVHNGLLAPVRQMSGLAAGVRTAVSVLLRGGRPDVSRATQEDEMFI